MESLREAVESFSAPSRPRTNNSKVFNCDIKGNSVNFVILSYSNRIFIIVSEVNRIGNLYSIQLESPTRNGVASHRPPVFNIRCLLGSDDEEHNLAVRALAEKLGITQTLYLSITFSDLSHSAVDVIAQFGQFVLGPPGSGKTTYCLAMSTLLKNLGRKVEIINLDPANDDLPYETSVNIVDLVTVDEVMETQGIGPNGSLVFCMELLEHNLDWLMDKLLLLKDSYLIFDLPGQAELFTHHSMVRNILEKFQRADLRLCSVFLVDSHYANDPGKYMSALLLTLNSMIQLEAPTVNILSKVDSVERYGSLEFGLDYYTEVLDLDFLLEALDKGPLTRKYQKLNSAIAEVVTNYSLVSFLPLSVDDRNTLLNVMKAVDKANGYIFGAGEERNIQRLLSCAVGAQSEHERLGAHRETFMNSEQEQEDEELLRMIATQNA